MKALIFSILIIFTSLFFGCNASSNLPPANNTTEQTIEESIFLNFSNNVLDVIKNKDMEALASYVNFEHGIRFTTSTFVDKERDVILKPDELKNAFKNSKEHIWGTSDGKGDEIKLTFKDYYEKYIYDKDFLNADIVGNNVFIGSCTAYNNAKEVYPNSKIIEYHFKGFDPQYNGIDWESLRLVFEQIDNKWYLVGIIHAQWTV